MAQRDQNKALTKEELDRVHERIKEVRSEIGFTVGDNITYDLLYKVLKWVNSRVDYHTDQEEYKATDEAFLELAKRASLVCFKACMGEDEIYNNIKEECGN